MKSKTLVWSLLFVIILGLAMSSVGAIDSMISPVDNHESGEKNIYFFYGDGCPHCSAMEPYLEELLLEFSDVTLNSFETWKIKENSELFIKMSEACGKAVVGVPTLFVGHQAIIGFDSAEGRKGKEVREAIEIFSRDGGPDLMKMIGTNLSTCPFDEGNVHQKNTIDIPFYGELDPSEVSLPVFTVILGLLDGFNPCAMWVLMFLLTLLVYTRSRKKMFTVGGVFILVSGLVYYLFMAAWLNLFLFIGIMAPLRIGVGLLALFIGIINIKEMFAFKKGISLSIPDSFKPKILKKMRGIVNDVSLPASLFGVAVLAFTVNMVELLCTAGFPAIYTNVLALNDVSTLSHYLYIGLYILMYMLDDAIVFTIAVATLSSKKLTEDQGKWLKFISGLLMVILGAALVFKPELLMFG